MLKIKSLPILAMVFCAALVLCAATVSGDERTIYTWTDERGNLHVTDEPPPPDAKLKEVETYREKTPEEIEYIEDMKEQREENRRIEDLQQEAEQARRDAADAQTKAIAATEQAETLTREAQEYVRRFGNTPERRKQFKYKIQAKKEQALAAQDAALEARALADQAKQTANEKITAAEKAASQPASPEELELQIDE